MIEEEKMNNQKFLHILFLHLISNLSLSLLPSLFQLSQNLSPSVHKTDKDDEKDLRSDKNAEVNADEPKKDKSFL